VVVTPAQRDTLADLIAEQKRERDNTEVLRQTIRDQDGSITALSGIVTLRDARIAELEREIEATWTALGVHGARGVTLPGCASAHVTLRKNAERERDEVRAKLERIRTWCTVPVPTHLQASVLRILNEGDV
jgi:hypothetical protein